MCTIVSESHIELVRNKIINDILSGLFPPDSSLKVDHLKERYDVGNIPIREALARLLSTGLISQEDMKGYKVIALTEESVIDLFVSACEIEKVCLEHSIKNSDINWEADIQKSFYILQKIEENFSTELVDKWMLANDDFHDAIISNCLLKALIEIRNKLWLKTTWITKLLISKEDLKMPINNDEHKNIVDACFNKDIDLVKKHMEHHMLSEVNNTIKYLKLKRFIK